ncbi:MAG: hypothetical protein EB078_08380 [Proteobacteria bacterium]|nr:hypothetical protein [Pseudomonadota bacterium]NDC25037.1 hypothetical protein [Pseudomonadota bacterium]NDD04908.1 hypothetical protein [Pseudomonadota bacterium]NDG26303.1 hypothetical protein [Pseudomonadota bacterium]
MKSLSFFSSVFLLTLSLCPVFGGDHTAPTLDESGRRTAPREANGNWDPHQMVEKMLERVNGPHLKNWEQRPPDAFEAEMTAILNRLKDTNKDLDPSEVDLLNNWAGRLVNSQEALIKAFENIKNQTESTANEVQKANLKLLLEAFETRLLRATVLKERVAHHTGKSPEKFQVKRPDFHNIFQGAILR